MKAPFASPWRCGLLSTLLLVGILWSVNSVRTLEEDRFAARVCEAVDTPDYARALAMSDALPGASEAVRRAAECRCLALFATQAGDECEVLLERLIDDPATGSWAPRPALSVHLIQTWREAGRGREAAAFARRAARFHPEDPDLFYLELVTRSGFEDEEAVLREMAARIPEGAPASARMRVSLANRHLQRGDSFGALEALGERPESTDAALERWFELRGMAFATAVELRELKQTYSAWREAGGEEAELRARYALTLSISGLGDPDHTTLELLEAAVAESRESDDPTLREALEVRLILTLAASGEHERAIAAHDAAREHFELEGLDREELERSATHQALAFAPKERRRGKLRFSVVDAPPMLVLSVSADADEPVDNDYEAFPLTPSGGALVTRHAGTAPQRWVLRDAANRLLTSGTVNPMPGQTIEVEVALPDAEERLDETWVPSRLPADGRPRQVLIVLDCADWRIIQYLRARGELPVLDALLTSGYRAVLNSDPPLTAAALESLVWPGATKAPTFVGFLHQFGTELAGLSSVGENPLSMLSWVLPERPNLFGTIGAGERSAANLLFSHGGIEAGRHGEVSGPRGARRRVPLSTSSRDLDAGERGRWPLLAAVDLERDAIHLRTIAAEFDVAEEIATAGEIDFLALRIEPLDILTHRHFARAVKDGQDEGRGILFSVYRYIDARLGEIDDRLDGDDVLIVMSDHGIRTAMEHSRHALFVASGPDIPAGRAPGTPDLRGVPRAIADLLGIQSDWPDTGITEWTQAAVSAPDGGD